MPQRFAPAIAANRFGLGCRPGELARIGRDPRGWLENQLTGGPALLQGENLSTSAEILGEALKLREEARAERRRAASMQDTSTDEAESAANPIARSFLKLPAIYRPVYVAEVTARFQQVVASERSFIERLTHFWTNHFAVSVDKIAVLGLAGSFEREAIRPHVLGRFPDLLLAVERHPAMLLYLDNHLSVGPNSRAARVVGRRGRGQRQLGINENLAREILELHTLGVNGGYSQADVTALAQVITGWSIGGELGRLKRGTPGEFVFRPEIHEPGAKQVLGKRYAEDGYEQGVAVLRDLAASSATASFLATKLARHFIADDPPASAVERLKRAYLESDGDLPSVYRTLITAPEAWAERFAKYKTPSDYIFSAFRGLDLPVQGPRAAVLPFELLGQRTYGPGSPAGWPDRSADWDGASALMKRIEWADAMGQRLGSSRNAAQFARAMLGETLTDSTLAAIGRAASASQALTLLLTSPEFLRR